MTKEELEKWFLDKFNSCYSVKHIDYPHKLFMFYDGNFIRQKKLARVLEQDLICPTKVDGICLFEIDYQTNKIWCDYSNIWVYFINYFSPEWIKIQLFIQDILLGYVSLNISPHTVSSDYRLTDHSKLILMNGGVPTFNGSKVETIIIM